MLSVAAPKNQALGSCLSCISTTMREDIPTQLAHLDLDAVGRRGRRARPRRRHSRRRLRRGPDRRRVAAALLLLIAYYYAAIIGRARPRRRRTLLLVHPVGEKKRAVRSVASANSCRIPYVKEVETRTETEQHGRQ